MKGDIRLYFMKNIFNYLIFILHLDTGEVGSFCKQFFFHFAVFFNLGKQVFAVFFLTIVSVR